MSYLKNLSLSIVTITVFLVSTGIFAEDKKLEPGFVSMFDGKTLKWAREAKQVLHRVPSGYERRRAKARIEKTARVRGLTGISQVFAVDMIEVEFLIYIYTVEFSNGS